MPTPTLQPPNPNEPLDVEGGSRGETRRTWSTPRVLSSEKGSAIGGAAKSITTASETGAYGVS